MRPNPRIHLLNDDIPLFLNMLYREYAVVIRPWELEPDEPGNRTTPVTPVGPAAYEFFEHPGRSYWGVDELRVRPLFIGLDDAGGFYMASGQKALVGCFVIRPVESGSIGIHGPQLHKESSYFDFTPGKEESIGDIPTRSEYARMLRDAIVKNVADKLHPEREFGFLLSCGLDSSLICGIAAKLLAPTRIKTFTVGFDVNAPDVLAARKVAKHIDSIHTEYIFTFADGIAIPFSK